MVSFILFLALVIGFIVLNGRISRLEETIRSRSDAGKILPKSDVSSGSRPEVPSAVTAPPPPVVPGATAISSHREFEFRLGGKFFTAVGAVAVIFGIGFFLRYAFENNLITETMRVVLGLVAGTLMLGIGQFLKTKYFGYSQILSGTGLGILYLTLFAAFSYYSVLPFAAAFAGMAVVTALGASLAIRDNSLPLAGFALFGGFLTPFLIKSGMTSFHELFLYVALLDIGMLLIALNKNWRVLTLGCLFGTALVYVSWHIQSYAERLFPFASAYLSVFFLIFFGAVLTRLFLTRIRTDENDFALFMFNPMFYFVAGYALINPLYPSFSGLFAFLLAALHLILGFAVSRKGNSDSKYFLFGVGFLLVFIGIPIQLEKNWITLGWAGESLVLLFLALKQKSSFFRNAGIIMFAVSGVRMLAVDLSIKAQEAPWLNQSSFTFALFFIALFAGFVLYRSSQGEEEDHGEARLEVTNFLAGEAFLISFIWLTVQITHFYPTQYWLAIGWAGFAFATGCVALYTRLKLLRYLAYFVFALTGFRLLFFDAGANLTMYSPVANFRFLAYMLGAGLAGVYGYLIYDAAEVDEQEKKGIVPAFHLAVSLLVLWILSLEVLDFFNLRIAGSLASGAAADKIAYGRKAALSVAWALYAVIQLMIGLWSKSSAPRLFAILLFWLVIFKVFLYDPADSTNLFRFVSFISLGIILLLTGYLYNRFRDRISEFILNKEDNQ